MVSTLDLALGGAQGTPHKSGGRIVGVKGEHAHKIIRAHRD